MPSSTQNSALYCYYFYSFVFMLFVLDTGYGCMHWDIYGGLLVVQCIKGWWWNWIWFLIIGFLDSLEPSEHHCWVFMWVQPNVCANKQKTIRQILDEGDMFFWQPSTWSYIHGRYLRSLQKHHKHHACWEQIMVPRNAHHEVQPLAVAEWW
jgi:hypothetical protein